MPTTIKVDAAAGCVVINFAGDDAGGGLYAAIEKSIAEPNYRHGMNFLADLTSTPERKPGYSDFTGRVEAWAELCKKIGACKIATLHGTTVGYGTGRQAAALLAHSPVERQPFTDLESAAKWLEVPVAALKNALKR